MTESAAYRALVRLNLIDPAARRPRHRKWKRWERGEPMELWQMEPRELSLLISRALTQNLE